MQASVLTALIALAGLSLVASLMLGVVTRAFDGSEAAVEDLSAAGGEG